MKTIRLVFLFIFLSNSVFGIDRALINEAKEHLKFHEGFRSKPYICPGGKPTIGYGHQLRKGENIKKISERQADNLLERDIRVRFLKVKKKYKLNDKKTMALTLFSFNLGIGTLFRSTMAKTKFKVNLHNNWTVYCKVKGKPHKVLKKRREFEYKMFKSGERKPVSVIILKNNRVKNGNDNTSRTIQTLSEYENYGATRHLQSQNLLFPLRI